MRLFYVTRTLDFRERPITTAFVRRLALEHIPSPASEESSTTREGKEEAPIIQLSASQNGQLTEHSIYMGFSRPFFDQIAQIPAADGQSSAIRFLTEKQQNAVLARPRMPVRLGHERENQRNRASLDAQLASLQKDACLKVIVINRFCPAFGDSVVLLGALRQFRQRLMRVFSSVQLDLLQHPDNLDAEALSLASGLVDQIHHLPAPLSLLCQYDAYLDLSANYQSVGLPWVDEMIRMFGIDPADIPDHSKRSHGLVMTNVGQAIRTRVAAARAQGQPLVLFHPQASSEIRSIPPSILPHLVNAVLADTDCTLITCVPVRFSHPRVLDWRDLSTTFSNFTAIISAMDAVLTVDTCVYHIADAVDVPGVALFTSVLPSLRTARYPRITGLLVCNAPSDVSDQQIITTSDDAAHFEQVWQDFDSQSTVLALNHALKMRIDADMKS